MPPSPTRTSGLWLVLCAAAAVLVISALFLLWRSTGTADLGVARDAERAEPASAGPGEVAVVAVSASASRRGIASPGSQAATEEFDERYRRALSGLRGRILLEDQAPLPDFPVEAFLGSAAPLVPTLEELSSLDLRPPAFHAGRTRTDAEGRFTLSPVTPRALHVLILGAGTGRAAFRLVDQSPAPGEVVDLGDIVLQKGVTVRGVVVDEDGAPVVGAKLWVADFPQAAFTFGLTSLTFDGGICFRAPFGDQAVQVVRFPRWVAEFEPSIPLGAATTGSDGTFRLDGVAPGRPSLWIRKGGLVPFVHGPVLLTAGKERDLGRLAMRRGETASGRVVDGAGHGIAGAQVMVGPAAMLSIPVSPLRSLPPTDAEGRFHIDGIGREKLQIVARRHEGDVWFASRPLAPDEDLVVQLEDGFRARVFVTSTRDGSVPDARIRIVRDDPIAGLRGFVEPVAGEQRARAEPDGSLLVTGLAKGGWCAQAFVPGHVPAGEKFTIEGDGEKVVRILVTPGLGAKVTVLEDLTSEPVACARVLLPVGALGPSAHPGHANDFPVDLGVSDRHGVLTIQGLPAGAHDLFVRHPQFGQQRATLVLPGPDLVVRLLGGGSLSGTVTKDGAVSAEPWMVSLERIGEERPLEIDLPQLACTTKGGAFRMTGVAPGRYRVEARGRLTRFAGMGDLMKFAEMGEPDTHASLEVEVAAARESKVALDIVSESDASPTGRIHGHVTVNGLPAPGIHVTAWSDREGRAVTDAAGQFELERVHANDAVTVRASDPGAEELFGARVLGSTTVKVEPGQSVEVTLAIEAGSLSGRVTLATDGKPVPGAVVVGTRTGGAGERAGDGSQCSTVADDRGRFRMANVVAGSYVLSAQVNGLARRVPVAATVRRGAESQDLLIELVPALTVAGTIELEPGPAPAQDPEGDGFWLSLRPKDGGGESGAATTQVHDGLFQFEELAPGSYLVELYGPGQDYAPLELTAHESQKGVHLRFVRKPAPAKGDEAGKKGG